MNPWFKTTALAMVGLSILMFSACKTSQPGVKNVAGTYSEMIDATPPQVTAAAQEVLNQMKLLGVEAESTDLDGKVTARTAQDKTVTVRVEKQSSHVSRMRVRVGRLGDQAISITILEKIKEKLSSGE